jgi:GxxExxY protein
MIENKISYLIRGAIFNVYNTLGPGLLENIYEAALIYELKEKGCKVESQVPIAVKYKGINLNLDYRIDLLVDGKVIVELKSVAELHDVHFKQLLTYMKISNKRLGLLVNFNTDDILSSIFRKII